jgi:hypothetical protein
MASVAKLYPPLDLFSILRVSLMHALTQKMEFHDLMEIPAPP